MSSSGEIPIETNDQSNPLQDDVGMERGEIIDETPDFLDVDDAVEVKVDDDDVPMDEDDDDELESEMAEGTVEVTDMSRAKLESHTGPVYAVCSSFDPVSKTLSIASGGGDDRAFIHRVSSGSLPQTHQLEHAHTDSVSCVAFNFPYVSDDLTKTPRLVAVGGYDGAIVLYNPDSGAKVDTLEGPSEVEWICFHQKGGTVLLAGSASDGTVWMYNIPLKRVLQVFVGHESSTSIGSFSPDGRWALTAGTDSTLRIWAPRTGKSKHVFRLGDGAGLTCMDVNGGSDGQLIIVGAEDGQAHVCHIGTKKVVASLRHYEIPLTSQEDGDNEAALPTSVEAVGFAPQAVSPGWCATAGVDGVLKVWDLTNGGQCRQTLREEGDGLINGGITRLIWHRSIPLIFTCTTNGIINLWDARTGRLVHSLTGSRHVINDMDIQYAEDGKTAIIVSASDDSAVRVYDLDVPGLLHTSVVIGNN